MCTYMYEYEYTRVNININIYIYIFIFFLLMITVTLTLNLPVDLYSRVIGFWVTSSMRPSAYLELIIYNIYIYNKFYL